MKNHIVLKIQYFPSLKLVIKTIIAMIIFLLIQACDNNLGPEIKLVTISIKNDTDLPITIYYAQEDGKYVEDTSVEQKSFSLQVDEIQEINIRKNYWDGDFMAIYNGNSEIYDIDFTLAESEPVIVQIADFQ